MKILVLTWEFPPRIVGGISRHVAELYPELVLLGHEIHLVTIDVPHTPDYECIEGIHVYRVPVPLGDDFFQWVGRMNECLGHKGGELLRTVGSFDLIHAHDWLVGDAAIALKHHFRVPLIATIHATEYGRYNGIHTETHDYIARKEKQLANEAWRVIVCSQYMRDEVGRALAVPGDKTDVIYNGIRPEKKKHPADFDRDAFRARFATPEEKIIYYVGRMAYEKGVSVLLAATPKVLAALEGRLRVVIIGGGNTDRLKEQAWHSGIWNHCLFTGFMSDEDLDRFQTVANCAVFPSLYEPFGIVALESFAARVPVVVSNSGGLPEVVHHGETGIVTYANNPDSLAWGILEILRRPEFGRHLVEQAYRSLQERFCWADLAQQTEAVYGRVVQERVQVLW